MACRPGLWFLTKAHPQHCPASNRSRTPFVQSSGGDREFHELEFQILAVRVERLEAQKPSVEAD